jgi:CRISPR-associated protein Cas1
MLAEKPEQLSHSVQPLHEHLLLPRQFHWWLPSFHGGKRSRWTGPCRSPTVRDRNHKQIKLIGALGIEGTAARRYFSEFTGMLKGEGQAGFDLDARNRRPPRDPVNALLSFCYSLLSKELALAVRAAGLDGMLGFYHQPHFGRPSLALDLMEEFRPVIADSVVVSAINNGVIQQDDFVRAAGAVSLTPGARKRLILAFERRMDQLVTHPVFDYRISYRRVLEVQARLLSRVLLGEIAHYPEFRVR